MRITVAYRRTKGEDDDTLFFVDQNEPPLTKDELRDLKRNLSLLSQYSVEQAYRDAHKAATMDRDRLPSPKVIQQLVAAWKQLWLWRKR